MNNKKINYNQTYGVGSRVKRVMSRKGAAWEGGHYAAGINRDIDLITIQEVAIMLRCSIRHVHNLKRRGYFEIFRPSSKILRFHRASVEKYISDWSTRVNRVD